MNVVPLNQHILHGSKIKSVRAYAVDFIPRNLNIVRFMEVCGAVEVKKFIVFNTNSRRRNDLESMPGAKTIVNIAHVFGKIAVKNRIFYRNVLRILNKVGRFVYWRSWCRIVVEQNGIER